jgi:hypothetical protein
VRCLKIESLFNFIELISIFYNTDDDSSVASEAPVKRAKKDKGDTRSIVDAWNAEEEDSDSGSDSRSQDSKLESPSNQELNIPNMKEWMTACKEFSADVENDVVDRTPSDSSKDPPSSTVSGTSARAAP